MRVLGEKMIENGMLGNMIIVRVIVFGTDKV